MYPSTPAARDRFVLERRGPRTPHDPWRYQNLIVEDERTAEGPVTRVATLFLTGRECPWRCVMCDLWQHTITTDTPAGAIPAQIAAARRALEQRQDRFTQIKLYNAGNFFDPRAVPEGDYHEVAGQLGDLTRVIVESHPALIGFRVDRFLDQLDRRRTRSGRPVLEVAMGLETVSPGALERLHKRMTVDEFAAAAEALGSRGVALRVFLLVSPPFVPADEQDTWLLRSVDVALSCGAGVVSLVPTRPGNGALAAVAADGDFRAPRLEDIERSLELAQARSRHRGRVFADLWDLERFAHCPHCFDARWKRLHAMNLEQRHLPQPSCPHCPA
jgi:radical SAM enzyme (TIGR01210 family)